MNLYDENKVRIYKKMSMMCQVKSREERLPLCGDGKCGIFKRLCSPTAEFLLFKPFFNLFNSGFV